MLQKDASHFSYCGGMMVDVKMIRRHNDLGINSL